ncbi:MAG: hypothetical protein ACTS4Y_00395 [Candidatus Hodgkinia cicadicola]
MDCSFRLFYVISLSHSFCPLLPHWFVPLRLRFNRRKKGDNVKPSSRFVNTISSVCKTYSL